MRFTASEIARATGGSLLGPEVGVAGASIDSRTLAPGNLFVPVVADRDGHDFIAAAVAAGAPAYLTAHGKADVDGTAVEVADTADALATIGAVARDRLPDRVVGITGSAGKTSTKDLLRSIVARAFRTAASVRSFNNELGVPLTLVNSDDDTEAAVLEMGARGVGHIAYLCRIARPTVAVVINVGYAHTEMFGSPDGVAKAKGELVEALPDSGTAVLNADDDRVIAMRERTSASVVTFGATGDVRADDVIVDGALHPSFTLQSPWGDIGILLAARGRHQVANALAAAAAALALGVGLDDVAAGLAEAQTSPWRMELARTPSGALVLNDSYNANPISTAAALEALVALDARRRIAVLGPMLELGDVSAGEHRRIGQLAAELGVEVIAVAAPEYGARTVDSLDEALAAVGDVGDGDAVLLKASRAAGLERLATMLVGEAR